VHADDDHGDGSRDKGCRGRAFHHHHGAVVGIADPARFWNPFSESGCDVRKVPIVLKKSFPVNEQKILGPLMRFGRADVRNRIVSHKTTRDLRIGAMALCSDRNV
jgi:hypothetical protein